MPLPEHLKLGDVAELTDTGLVLNSVDANRPVTKWALSVSAAWSLQDDACHAKWAGEQLMPRGKPDPFSARDRGTFIHNVYENLMSLPGPERTVRAAMGLLSKEAADLYPDDEATRGRWLEMAEPITKGLWQIEDPREVDVHSLETELKQVKVEGIAKPQPVRLAGIKFYGKSDRISHVSDGVLRIEDYKTGKYSDGRSRFGDKEGDQTVAYAMAAEQVFDVDIAEGRLLYVAHGKDRVVDAADPKRRTEVERKLTLGWTNMNDSRQRRRFKAKTGPLCNYCPLVAVCPAGYAKGYTVMTSKSPEVAVPHDVGLPAAGEVKLATAVGQGAPVSAPAGVPDAGDAAHVDGMENIDIFAEDAPRRPRRTRRGSATTTQTAEPAADFDDEPASPAPARRPRRPRSVKEVEPVGEDAPIEDDAEPVEPVVEDAPIKDDAEPAPRPAEERRRREARPAPERRPAKRPAHWASGKPYNRIDSSGNPIAESYAATRAFSMTSLAVINLAKQTTDIQPRQIAVLAQTYLHMILTAQERINDDPDLQSGLATRLEGALRTCLESFWTPALGDEAAVWDEWVTKTIRRMVLIANTAHLLVDTTNFNPDSRPWAALTKEEN